MVVSQFASGSHVRPKGATPLRVPLVPAFKQCTAANTTHGFPLAFPSCHPPQHLSSWLTVGTPESNGAGVNSIGFVLLRVKVSTPEDVRINANGTDIRCQPGTAATVCNSPNAVAGPDYSGEVQGTVMIRGTDHYNGPGLTDAATVIDTQFPVNGTCANTLATTIGGTCSIATTANTVVPGAIKDTQRAVIALDQINVFDGGQDGRVSTADNTLFAEMGIFVP
jgi:hypothetical protein